MSRNAAIHDAAGQSFAGLMEDLTEHNPSRRVFEDLREFSASKAGSETTPRSISGSLMDSVSISHSSVRSGSRSLLATLPPDNPSKSDSSIISYEKALRIHGRHRRGVKDELPKLDTQQPGSVKMGAVASQQRVNTAKSIKNAKGRSSKSAAGVKSNAPSARSKSRSKAQAKSQSKLQSEPRSNTRLDLQSTPLSANFPKATVQASGLEASAASSRPNTTNALKGKARSRTHSAKGRRDDSLSPASERLAGALRETSRTRRSKKSQGASQPAYPLDESDYQPSESALEHSKKQPEAIVALAPASQEIALDLRRTFVSIRLTEKEFARLRDRADESGVSVSAYMRSCVLDAETLRSQVKRALAEIRAFSARPVPNPLPVLAASGRTSANGHAWFQMLCRSAAMLLGPLFAFRRSA